MRDLTRSLNLMLILMVALAGLLGARCGGPAGTETEREDPVETARLQEPAFPPIQPASISAGTLPTVEPASVPPPAAMTGPTPHDGANHPREGRLAFEAGEFEKSRDHLLAALGEDEGRTSDRYLLGLSLLRTGEAERAVEQLSRVVMESPELVRPRTNLARALLASDDAEAALGAAREATDRFPDFADAWQVLGRSYLELKRFEDAADAFLAAVEIDPGHGWAWNNLGYAMIQQGRFDEAVPMLREAATLRPGLALAQNNLGVALERSGDLAGAREAYRAAVEAGDAGRASASLARVEQLLPADGPAEEAGNEAIVSVEDEATDGTDRGQTERGL